MRNKHYKPKAPAEVIAKRKAYAEYLAKKYPAPPKKQHAPTGSDVMLDP